MLRDHEGKVAVGVGGVVPQLDERALAVREDALLQHGVPEESEGGTGKTEGSVLN